MRRFLAVLLFCCVPLAALAAPAAPVLVLGDSLSAAHGIPIETGWVTLLSKRLDTGEPVARRAVVNASISGETTSGGLARLPALLSTHKPGIVVVELGANDGLRGLPLPDIRKNVASLVKLSRDAGARVVLVGIELPINYGPQYRDGLRAMYRDVAAEFNVPLVPFLLEGVALDPALMQDDGLHPVAAAQPKVLETVWAVLKDVLAAP
ncbi:arylesterase [Tahibacter soli]|uniref:Arylesterase n=1 Tax=Tahibacter soli TaxID=2983605 RepID=A0A9X3YSK0_9GAMM|nr:arylesterase [Tahibacter soli]MDC8015616.1 arylesterase [Tahibacter soli]